MPLFDNACTGTGIINTIPTPCARAAWQAWAGAACSTSSAATSRTAHCRRCPGSWRRPAIPNTPTGPINYGAWYISQVVDILVSNPDVFSKTVLILNYDEADGSFDHIIPPFPPQSPAFGASTVNFDNEIVTTDTPNGPIGLGTRVPFVVISPWSKGGYVNLPGLRSHLGDPVHRKALRCDGDQHLPVAPCRGR